MLFYALPLWTYSLDHIYNEKAYLCTFACLDLPPITVIHQPLTSPVVGEGVNANDDLGSKILICSTCKMHKCVKGRDKEDGPPIESNYLIFITCWPAYVFHFAPFELKM